MRKMTCNCKSFFSIINIKKVGGFMVINGKEIRINRENAVVSEVDEAYCKLLRDILKNGIEKENRTGINTKAIAGWNYKFDLSKGFPIMETKDVVARNFTNEIQWIHQVQSNNVTWLRERGNRTWDGWVVDDDGIYRIYEQGENAINDPEREVPLKIQVLNPETGVVEKIPYLDKYGKEIMVKSKDVIDGKTDARTIKEAVWFGPEYIQTIGKAYGGVNSITKSPQRVEWTLKNNPMDRRMNIVLWVDEYLPEAVLPSCVWSSEYMVTPDGKLHSYVHQRSADVPAGLPFNISQYAVLLSMFAKANGYEVGTMSWSIMDAHIYLNQIDKMEKQYKRYKYMKQYSSDIKKSSDEEIERLYYKECEYWRQINRFVVDKMGEKIDDLKISERVELIEKKIDKKMADCYQKSFETKTCLEHMLTRETPQLELASHDSIFEYSTDYVQKGDPYLKENPIGNKEIVLKKYHPTPFISVPIAQ